MAGVRITFDTAVADAYALKLADNHIRPVANNVLRSARGGVRVKTGAVLASLRMERKTTRKYVRYTVGGDHRRTMLEHQGSPPHDITPRREGGLLVFYWDKVGHVVRRGSVRHPGMRGSRFLVKPLAKFGGMAGMRVTLTADGYSAIV